MNETTEPEYLRIMHALARAVGHAVFLGNMVEMQRAKEALDDYRKFLQELEQ